MSQSQPLRVEDSSVASFITSKTTNAQLLFVNNKKLENRILGYMAKYQEQLGAIFYAINIQGNHIHEASEFPNKNRALFMQHTNARAAEGVRFYVPGFKGGNVFARRYSQQDIIDDASLEERFFYCALQPVSSGLCERISDYPGYNSFNDAISGMERTYKIVDWAGYNKKKKYNPDVKISEFTRFYTLKYKRLPQYNHLSQKEYKELMLEKLETRRLAIVKKKKEEGYVYPDPSFL